MIFKIVGRLPISDEDGNPIEVLEIEKAKVRVSVVGTRVCVAESYLHAEAELKRALSGSIFVPQIEQMNTRQRQANEEWKRVVKIGDAAVSVSS